MAAYPGYSQSMSTPRWEVGVRIFMPRGEGKTVGARFFHHTLHVLLPRSRGYRLSPQLRP